MAKRNVWDWMAIISTILQIITQFFRSNGDPAPQEPRHDGIGHHPQP